MKKIASVLVLVFAFTLTVKGQKKGVEKKAEKLLATMNAELNLTKEQESKILPVLIADLEDKKIQRKQRKELKESGKIPSKEELKQFKKVRNQKRKAMTKKIATILNEEQFEKYKLLQEQLKKKKKNKN